MSRARGVGMNTLEVFEPRLQSEAARIVLDRRQLRQSHRSVKPPIQAGHCTLLFTTMLPHPAERECSGHPRERG